METQLFQILLASIFLTNFATTSCLAQQTYYVKPDPNTRCETEFPCHTLIHYLQNYTYYFRSNTAFVFLPGRFNLSVLAGISGLQGLALLGSDLYSNVSDTLLTGVPEPSTEIYCTEPGCLVFYNITNLYLANFVITNCTCVVPGFLSSLNFIVVTNLSIVGMLVRNSTGHGAAVLNTAGNVTIYGSTFSGTEGNNLVIQVNQDSGDCVKQDTTSLNLMIQSSQFLFGAESETGLGAAGLFLRINSPCHDTRVTITDAAFIGNVGTLAGGNVYMELVETDTLNTVCIDGSYFAAGKARVGGGLNIYILEMDDQVRSTPRNSNPTVVISNSQFVGNEAELGGGGVAVQTDDKALGSVRMKNVTFDRNSCFSPECSGGAISIGYIRARCSFVIEDSSVSGGVAGYGGGIYLQSHNTQEISNTTIQYNIAKVDGGGIFAFAYRSNTDIHVHIGNASVTNNTALHGGNVGIEILENANCSVDVEISHSYIAKGRATNGGGVLIYQESRFSKYQSKVSITDTLVVDNSAERGGGLYLFLCNAVEVDIVQTTFSRNQAVFQMNSSGGNMLILDCAASGTVRVKDCNIEHGKATQAAGLLYSIVYSFPTIPIISGCQLQMDVDEILHFSGTHFLDNVSTFGPADISVYIDFYQDVQVVPQHSLKMVQFEECTFTGSSACPELSQEKCAVIGLDGRWDPQPKAYNMVGFRFADAVFHGESGSAVIELSSVHNINFSNCSFVGNNATALMASSSNIYFEGSLLFKDNVGYDGGALALFHTSTLFFYPNAHIQILGNSALHAGGGIYVDQAPHHIRNRIPCFFQAKLNNRNNLGEAELELYNITIDLINNTAVSAGSAIYGGDVDCSSNLLYYYTSYSEYTYASYFNMLFNVITSDGDHSAISSDPIGVCFCINDLPDCTTEPLSKSTYPGALVVTPAVAVGRENGTVRDGVVLTNYSNSGGELFTGKTSSSGNLCQDVELRVYSPPGTVTVVFRPGEEESFLYSTRELQVSVLQCPLGFELQSVSDNQYMHVCDCTPFLTAYGIRCFIDTLTFRRPPNVWIGTTCTNLSTVEDCKVAAHDHCPFQYCTPQQTELTLNDTDSQCNHNRSGILCGGCRPGLNLVLGTSRCLQCSNKFLSLTLVFAVAGLALVIIMMVCNMTVSDGAISGLIFYANIAGINSAIFFPIEESDTLRPNTFLRVFIAWFNLDLGIETCFYKGMDTYQKTWLQFIFPLYIWAIVLALITSTHYSTLASKVLVRRNAVKVLATLFLLSFAKLLRTTIAAFSYVIVRSSDEQDRVVWLYDANVGFLTGKHIPLFVVALLVFVLLILPYTAVLTFNQCVRRFSKYRLLYKLITRLLPLFDAYAGPYKDGYQFWSGLLLIIRSILFLIFAFNALQNPNIDLLAISTATLLLTAFTAGISIYKKWSLTVLEAFLHVDLCLLSLATLYVRSSGGSQAAVTGTLVGLVFVTFVATVSYRTYQELKKTKLRAWIRNTCMHISGGWRHLQVEEQPQQPVQRRSRVQHWEISLGDPESGEVDLVPCSPLASPQSSQTRAASDSTRAREYSAEALRRRLQPPYCPPESQSPTHSLTTTHYSEDPPIALQPCDTDSAPTNPHPSNTTTSDNTGSDSHSDSTRYRTRVQAFLEGTSDDDPECLNYNELETIRHEQQSENRRDGECTYSRQLGDSSHHADTNINGYAEEAPSTSSSTDYRAQIFEILAFDSSTHDHSYLESNQLETTTSDTSDPADENERLLQNCN